MVLWYVLTFLLLCKTPLSLVSEDLAADVYSPPVRRERVEVAINAHGALSGSTQDVQKANGKGDNVRVRVRQRELLADKADLPFKTDETGASQQQNADASTPGGDTGDQCAWWFGSFSADTCTLSGLRRRGSSTLDVKHLCSSSVTDRENCTGAFDAQSLGDGAWTSDGAGTGTSQEKDASGSWKCMEDAKYNWIDYNDCTAALPGFPEQLSVTKHPDDVAIHKTCWSCQWVMWYKKEHCGCCNPGVLVERLGLNGEECCDGIDRACGINGHDGRAGSPRGAQICQSQEGSSIPKTAACESLLAGNQYRGGAAAMLTSCEEAPIVHSSPHVNTCFDYMQWLRLDRSADANSLCEIFTGDAMTCFKVLGCKVFRQHDGKLVCGLVGSNKGVELDILDVEALQGTEALAEVGNSVSAQPQPAEGPTSKMSMDPDEAARWLVEEGAKNPLSAHASKVV
mmetsp:Transcript_24841/g.45592  ORF Transcript_24841/g.45592 Transcript_24841/m.45592 type:complete len:455 (+) Transcript_24841:62-1426(+)